MSDYTVEMLFTGQNDVSGVIDTIASDIDSFDAGVQAIADPFADFGKSVLAVDAVIAALAVTVGLTAADIRSAGSTISGSLDISEASASELLAVSKNLYNLNFGESVSDNAELVSAAFLVMKDASADVVEYATKMGSALEEAYGEDALKNIQAQQALVEDFGLTNKEAFDFIAAGYQNGLNSSGDFLDSIMEFSPQFSAAEATAGQFFSVMETGFAGGILGTEKAADAFKEYTLKLAEGTDDVKAAFEYFGLSYDTITSQVSTGTITATDSFGLLIEAFKETDTQSLESKAHIAAFGTQFEDLASKAANIDIAKTKMEDLADASDKLEALFDNLGNSFEKAFRTLQTELADADIWDDYLDDTKEIFDKLAELLPEAFKNADYGPISDAVDNIIEEFERITGINMGELLTAEGLSEAVQTIINLIGSIGNVTTGIISTLEPVIDLLARLADESGSMSSEMAENLGEILGSAILLAEAGTAVGAAFIAIGQSGTDANQVFETIVGSVRTAYNAMQLLLDIWTEFLSGVFSVSTGAAGDVLDFVGLDGAGESLKELSDSLDRLNEAAADNRLQNFDEMMEAAGHTATAFRGELGEAAEAMNALPDAKYISLETELEIVKAQEDYEKLLADLDDRGVLVIEPTVEEQAIDSALEEAFGDLDVAVTASPDQKSFEAAEKIITEILPDGTRSFTMSAAVDNAALTKAADDIENAIPNEKLLQIEADLQIAQIAADSAKVDALLQYKAEVDIAEIEAAAKEIEAAFGSIDTGLESTGSVIESLFGGLSDFMGTDTTSTQLRWAILEQLETENELRERTLTLQENLTKAQIDYMDARTQALESGNPLITVEANNLSVPLEMIFIEILEAVQLRANQDGLEALIGL